MELSQAIQNRRSVRAYAERPIEADKIERILQAGIYAPSGKNGQPWRFVIVQNDKTLLRKIADCTVYTFVRKAGCLLCVFMDKAESYHYIKDCQAIGACIQNMLLAATDFGIGACWIGEILNRDAAVKTLLGIDNRYELAAVLALGYPKPDAAPQPSRKSVQDCMLMRL